MKVEITKHFRNKVECFFRKELHSLRQLRQSVQHTIFAHTDLLKEKKIQISMTESGNTKDTAVTERVNNSTKNKLLKGLFLHALRKFK